LALETYPAAVATSTPAGDDASPPCDTTAIEPPLLVEPPRPPATFDVSTHASFRVQSSFGAIGSVGTVNMTVVPVVCRVTSRTAAPF
jgi:hypothetical protein